MTYWRGQEALQANSLLVWALGPQSNTLSQSNLSHTSQICLEAKGTCWVSEPGSSIVPCRGRANSNQCSFAQLNLLHVPCCNPLLRSASWCEQSLAFRAHQRIYGSLLVPSQLAQCRNNIELQIRSGIMCSAVLQELCQWTALPKQVHTAAQIFLPLCSLNTVGLALPVQLSLVCAPPLCHCGADTRYTCSQLAHTSHVPKTSALTNMYCCTYTVPEQITASLRHAAAATAKVITNLPLMLLRLLQLCHPVKLRPLEQQLHSPALICPVMSVPGQ